MRALILERDAHRCTLEYPGCEGVATTVDHLVPRRHGGLDVPANLRAACNRCKAKRGAGRPVFRDPVSAW